ncbi:MAG: methyl-accepting chemotaxis protein [Gammaproteobacteria bacterium]|nr:methyl-accepting chemotaxis protein [Gammaproteobacteria bacterium]
MMVVTKRSQGDTSIRAEVTGHDELGCLGDAFNTMADNVNRIAEREHDAAEALRSKVDILLAVVNRAAEGDLTGKVTFSGSDTIGELGVGLQTMIDNLDALIEGKRRDVALLQSRVDTILGVVTKAAEGDLTGHLSVEGDDAVAQLAAGVQRMVDNLNTLLAQVQESGIQVTSSGTEIAATAKQQEATVTQQAATANQIVATATEISATTKELVYTMDEVAAVAERTTDSAESSHSGLAKMEDTMGHVVDASATIAAKLEVLNEKAANINTVVTTITKVADQTNLLSLNAAIEAEKAGEYGLGFSVVATEIRRLADQTAVATWDIEQMVKEMQSAVSAGVMSVDKFSKEVQNSVDVVRQVGTELKQIIAQVQALTPRFESVHEGMQFQAQGAEQIKQAIVQLSEAAQQTVESLGQSNSAIERLNDAAHGLQTGVSRFKVLGHTSHHE